MTWNIPNGEANVYRGDLETPVVNTANQTNVTGTMNDDSAHNITFGNYDEPNSLNTDSDFFTFYMLGKELTLAEIQEQQYNHHVVEDCLILSFIGFDGVSEQENYCGNGITGTPSSGIVTSASGSPLNMFGGGVQ